MSQCVVPECKQDAPLPDSTCWEHSPGRMRVTLEDLGKLWSALNAHIQDETLHPKGPEQAREDQRP